MWALFPKGKPCYLRFNISIYSVKCRHKKICASGELCDALVQLEAPSCWAFLKDKCISVNAAPFNLPHGLQPNVLQSRLCLSKICCVDKSTFEKGTWNNTLHLDLPTRKMYLQCGMLVMLISKDSNVRIMSFLLADLQSAKHRAESKVNEEVRSSEKKQRASLR